MEFSWVQTDMGTAGAKANGMEDAPVTLQDSVRGILEQVSGIQLYLLALH